MEGITARVAEQREELPERHRFPLRTSVLWVGLLCLVPLLLLLLGVDLGTDTRPLDADGLGRLSPAATSDALHQAVRGGYTHTLLEWTAFCAAVFVFFLTFMQYRLTREPSLPILGVALLCAGTMDAFHILAANRLIEAVAENRNLIPFTWAICRLFNGLILLSGLLIVSKPTSTSGSRGGYAMVLGISAAFVVSAYVIIQLCANSVRLRVRTPALVGSCDRDAALHGLRFVPAT